MRDAALIPPPGGEGGLGRKAEPGGDPAHTGRANALFNPFAPHPHPIPPPDLRRYASSARPSPPGRDRAPLALAIRRAAARLFTVLPKKNLHEPSAPRPPPHH